MKAIVLTHSEQEAILFHKIVIGMSLEQYIKKDTDYFNQRRHFHKGIWIWKVSGKDISGTSSTGEHQLWHNLMNCIGFNQGYRIFNSVKEFEQAYEISSLTH
jgi:hypothetical protein